MTGEGESSPFLTSEENHDDDKCLPRTEVRTPRTRLYMLYCSLLVFLGALLAVNIALLGRDYISSSTCPCNNVEGDFFEGTFSPARSSIQYVVVESSHEPGPSPFTGEPRLELDQAWSNLLRSSMIKLSAEEMRRMNKTSIPLRDGSGYIGYLESIHMLHCVKRIYQSRYPEHYPKLRGTEAFADGHWDHCLEVLRRGIMCNFDVTINTYAWKTPTDIKGKREGSRKCTDWDKILEWADERAVKYDNYEKFLTTLVQGDEHGGTEPIDLIG